MGSSLSVTQTGLQAVEDAMGAVSDNLANAGTDGFKSQELDFETLLGEFIDGNALGGGAVAGGVSTDFSEGALVQTNSTTDLAIQGNGFFMLQEGSGATDYTRNGNMTIGNDGSLLAFNGANVMGYAVNSTGVSSGVLSPIVIPQGALAPTASSTVGLTGNLDAGSAPITGTIDPTNPATYTSSASVQLYDSLGNSHTLTIYYQNAGPTTSTPSTDQWNWTATLDGSATGLTNNSGSIQFNSAGAVVSGGTPSSPLSATVAGAAPLSLGLNFAQLTQFGTASSLSGTADGNAAGQPVGVSIDSDGGVSVTYSNGQSLQRRTDCGRDLQRRARSRARRRRHLPADRHLRSADDSDRRSGRRRNARVFRFGKLQRRRDERAGQSGRPAAELPGQRQGAPDRRPD